MALKSRWRANGLALVGSLLFSLLAAELLLRLLRLGYNHAPLNPSTSRHHEHPANFNFKAYSLQNEWGEFPIRTDRFGNRSPAWSLSYSTCSTVPPFSRPSPAGWSRTNSRN